MRTFRKTGVARVLFGRLEGDVLDDDELDSMILMPTVVIGCGLCLTAIFLFGYETLASGALHRLGHRDVPFEPKRFRHRAIAIHQVLVGDVVAARPGQ